MQFKSFYCVLIPSLHPERSLTHCSCCYGTSVCKSQATHWVRIISCMSHVPHGEGTTHLSILTELQSHLYQLYFISWTSNWWKKGGNWLLGENPWWKVVEFTSILDKTYQHTTLKQNVTLHHKMSRNVPDGHFHVFTFSEITFCAIYNGETHF